MKMIRPKRKREYSKYFFLHNYFNKCQVGIILSVVPSSGEKEPMIDVRFLEDDIKYSCPRNNVQKRLSSNTFLVMWKDGRNYVF